MSEQPPTKLLLSDQEWLSIMSDYKRSGLSQKSFCKKRQIDFTAFTNSRNRIAYRKKKASSKQSDQSQSSGFAAITLSGNPSAHLKLLHPNGVECSLPASLKEAEIIKLIRVLRTC